MSVMAWVSAAEPDLQQKMLQNISTFVTKIFGPAAEDVVRDGGELVRDPVGYPRPHAGPAVRPNHHSAIKLHCTQSCSRGHLNNEHLHIFMNLLQFTSSQPGNQSEGKVSLHIPGKFWRDAMVAIVVYLSNYLQFPM